MIGGGGLFGPIGALLAPPAAAILQAGLSTYLTRHDVLETELAREQPPSAARATKDDRATTPA